MGRVRFLVTFLALIASVLPLRHAQGERFGQLEFTGLHQGEEGQGRERLEQALVNLSPSRGL